jgi:uncharacterized protein with HEPN domain
VSSAGQWRQPPGDRLTFLAETVLAEAALLRITDSRVFAVPMDAARAGTLRHDIELAERVDAFVARFGRLQDTMGDKLLPAILTWLSEPVGPAIDNLARAERLGWIDSATEWVECRQLRNFMIHEYVRDMSTLAAALTRGHLAVPLLEASAQRLARQVLSARE